jgi:hypothetical protein
MMMIGGPPQPQAGQIVGSGAGITESAFALNENRIVIKAALTVDTAKERLFMAKFLPEKGYALIEARPGPAEFA